jgi:hypothetical protein
MSYNMMIGYDIYDRFIVFLPLIEILTKIINHTNKETVYNPPTGTYTYR